MKKFLPVIAMALLIQNYAQASIKDSELSSFLVDERAELRTQLSDMVMKLRNLPAGKQGDVIDRIKDWGPFETRDGALAFIGKSLPKVTRQLEKQIAGIDDYIAQNGYCEDMFKYYIRSQISSLFCGRGADLKQQLLINFLSAVYNGFE